MATPEAIAAAMDQLYADALEIYERAREEVTIERSDGRRQKYAATRYKQQIDKGRAEGTLVPTIAGIVKKPTLGFSILEEARRPDLMLETLVLDESKPYHRFFVAKTVQVARQRMLEYQRRHPCTRRPPQFADERASGHDHCAGSARAASGADSRSSSRLGWTVTEMCRQFRLISPSPCEHRRRSPLGSGPG